MRMPGPGKSLTSPLRGCTENGPTNIAAPPALLNEVLASSGQPLDTATRDFFELRFGYDFGGVRMHMGAKASESARSINALAYTVGNSIVWGAGQQMDKTREGRKLLAHELTHIVQQDMSPLPRSGTSQQRHLATAPIEQTNDATPQIVRQSGAPSDFIFRQDLPPEETFEKPFEFDEETGEMEEVYDEEPEEIEADEPAFDDENGEAPQEVVDPCDEMWSEIKPLLMEHEACSEIETLYWKAKIEESVRAELRHETNQTISEKKVLEDKKSELEPDLPERQELHDEQLLLLERQNEVLIENRDWAEAIWDLTCADLDIVYERYQPKEKEIFKVIEKLIALQDFIIKTGEKAQFLH
jgi:hypothetical protein